ncbi:SET domain containing protein [uncultured Caudovirales phage]|uniref:SET domain containing protein n=1 Tax=uncultured Caudovirales phage TaxID=2100421 RepID=A0A6J5RSC3_9CAUD|nr:SET domain containing protein [uncultured Caudovirales phage]
MYNKYLIVKQSKQSNNGVFTSIKIPKGVPILEVKGDLYVEHELPDPNHPALIQVGPNTFLGPSGDVDDYVNHSCNPNCRLEIVGNRAFLYSMYEIQPDSEITFDYSTSSTDTVDTWKMDCKCGYYNCRKLISGIQYVPDSIIADYKQKGMMPAFLAYPHFFQKR